jgi:UDP-N-acetylmuramyl tripeptide synthase
MKPVLTDSRRLTGANLFWSLPAAVIDASLQGEPGPFIAAWSQAAQALLIAVGQPLERLTHRVFDGGFSLLISAPVDALYSMCELNEAAFEMALAGTQAGDPVHFETLAAHLAGLFEEERNPRLLALQEAAHANGVPFLWDDDEVSIGYGKTARVWRQDELPDSGDIDWNSVDSIPVALVTGTNGKSTTVRMSASILAATGLRAGLTSTDWIQIGDSILDTGDYSGTGGARTLMRHPDTQVAVLETARGGLLRRGLGIERAAAALITNVASDHLGEYGINTVPELIEAKFIVMKALSHDAPLILNADDDGMVRFARSLNCKLAWFSLESDNRVIREQVDSGGLAAAADQGSLLLIDRGQARPIIPIQEIPATLGGAARHNIQNALGAAALCSVLGAPDEAIYQGLKSFSGDEQDNPGRGNWFRKDDIRILVDFAHNVHGMKALTDLVSRVPAQRRILLMGQAGDRLDRDITELAQAACRLDPDLIMPCALPGYERGRAADEVPRLIRKAVLDCGIPAEKVRCFDTPLEAAATALANARAGDLMVFLALTQRREILTLVHEFLGK